MKGLDSGTAARMLLPGLVGSGALWRRACDEVEDVHLAGDVARPRRASWVDKLAILQAVHQRRSPSGRFHVLDARTGRPTDDRWLAAPAASLLGDGGDNAGAVVIRHLDRLDRRRLQTAALKPQTPRRSKPQTVTSSQQATNDKLSGWQ